MLLTITSTHRPATDLGYLLHKRPGRLHTVDLAFGRGLMFYPEASEERCTFALVLDIDPVALVRGRGRGEGLLDQYVNDRPYAASSQLSVAMAQGLRSALNGRSGERQALADSAIPLVATVEPCPVRGDPGLIERLFGPLGYAIGVREIGADPIPADALGAHGEGTAGAAPRKTGAPYVALTLTKTTRLRDLLAHLYVLIPVLDRRKHYFVEQSEVEKLLAKGEGWLADHPARLLIVQRYLHHRRALTSELLRRLDEEAAEEEDLVEAAAIASAVVRDSPLSLPLEGGGDEQSMQQSAGIAAAHAVPPSPSKAEEHPLHGFPPSPSQAESRGGGDLGGGGDTPGDAGDTASRNAPGVTDQTEPPEPPKDAAETAIERPMRLHETRLDAVATVLRDAGCRRVVDLGCGSGKLLKRLLAERQFTDIVGIDVSVRDLATASRRLRLERLPARQRERIRLLQGALTYRDRRIEGFDAAALVEVIEHLEPDRLPALERVVFECARPGLVVVTTPNVEYNVRFPGMQPGQMRHADHRFEWTRAEFRAWAEGVAGRFGYTLDIRPLGPEDAEVGAPSQMGVFTR